MSVQRFATNSLATLLTLALLAACASRVTRDAATPTPAECGARGCNAPLVCCLANGRCLDPNAPSSASDCPVSAPDGGRPHCASDTQCPAGMYCATSDSCTGEGECISTLACPVCSGDPAFCNVCGCDGRTYESAGTACAAGVRVAASSACGVGSVSALVGCGTDSDCPSSYSCCAITGRCYPADCPACCGLPPVGSRGICRDDRDCAEGYYCDGPGCTGVGGCYPTRAPASCETGVLEPVCGCDGHTYTNACYPSTHGVRVAHDGAC